MKRCLTTKDATKLRSLIAEYEVSRNRAEHAMMLEVESRIVSITAANAPFPNVIRAEFYEEIANNHEKNKHRMTKQSARALKRIGDLITKLTIQED